MDAARILMIAAGNLTMRFNNEALIPGTILLDYPASGLDPKESYGFIGTIGKKKVGKPWSSCEEFEHKDLQPLYFDSMHNIFKLGGKSNGV
jgi:hypothetical protein